MTRPSHHNPRGGFRNPWPGAEPHGLGSLFRWFAERNTIRRPAPDPPASVFTLAKPELSEVRSSDELAVTWMGHSSVLVEFGSYRVLTDPMWGVYASPVPTPSLRRWVPPPLPLESLPHLDLVLLSHNHYDHLDAPTVRQLGRLQPQAQWLVPLGLGRFLRRLGIRSVSELDWWGEVRVGKGLIAATPAQHFSARGVHDRDRTLWAGFTVRVADRAIYFAGDTGYFPEFGGIRQRYGPFDALMLPVGAYEPRWFMRAVHMNPEDAVQAYTDLAGAGVQAAGESRSRRAPESPVLIPIHWGTFKLTDEPMDEPTRRLSAAWSSAGLPASRLGLLPHGGTRLVTAMPHQQGRPHPA